MKKYVKPMMSIEELVSNDVFTTSGHLPGSGVRKQQGDKSLAFDFDTGLWSE